jgi:hypothetical protein
MAAYEVMAHHGADMPGLEQPQERSALPTALPTSDCLHPTSVEQPAGLSHMTVYLLLVT